MIRAIAIYLAFGFGLVTFIKFVFHRPWDELIISYAFVAVPTLVFVLLAWGLRNLEERNLAPRWLAMGWGLCVALFVSAITAATGYLGMRLRLINSSDLGAWAMVSVICALIASGTVYYQSYRIILLRSSSKGKKGSGSI
jgi:membrane protease YdiL (CAAX protease family)